MFGPMHLIFELNQYLLLSHFSHVYECQNLTTFGYCDLANGRKPAYCVIEHSMSILIGAYTICSPLSVVMHQCNNAGSTSLALQWEEEENQKHF